MLREENGRYRTTIKGRDFTLRLYADAYAVADAARTNNGFSRKGPKPEQASYYYSEPQLEVTGAVMRDGKDTAVNGMRWLDHEWSTAYLDPSAERMGLGWSEPR